MKVMVNKNQFFDDLEDMERSLGMINSSWDSVSHSYGCRGTFEEMEVTMEELKDLIDKGYGIRINC